MRLLTTLVIAGSLMTSLCSAQDVHQWGLFETAIQGGNIPEGRQQYIELECEFTHPAGDKYLQRGFWDGGRVWKVRFSPGRVGAWRWASRCKDEPSLDGKTGVFNCTAYHGDNPFHKHGPIRVADNGRHFVHQDGTPFFWLVDTVWNGALKSTQEDWNRFLDDRAAKRFTGVQYVVTQWRTAYTNPEGQVAYTGYEKIQIHPEFFKRIDERTRAVNDKGLLAVPVLLWTLGNKEHNPGQLPEDQAILLARYMTARLGAWHVAYFLPGDGNYLGENAERWKRIGRAVFDRPGHPPVTLHPQGMQWPWDAFLNERWVSYFGYQSGHGDDGRTLEWIYAGPPSQKWPLQPARPIINLEPPYEDHIAYQSRQRHTAYSVRRATYWSLLNAPTAGSSYGAHGVWSWETSPNTPQEHGGTGVARPWHEAMGLPGSTDMKHMAELFTAIDWWRLRPDASLVATGQPTQPAPQLTHIVYTRSKDGRAVMYLDGKRAADRTVDGDMANWDRGFRLSLANELTEDRPWLGQLHQIAVYDRALGADDVERRFAGGRGARPVDPLVLYAFGEGAGDTVRDTSGRGEPLNLKISKPAAVRWISGGGLDVQSPVLIACDSDAAKVTDAIGRTQQITVEAWVKPANLTQAGPARIVTISRDTGQRNFTLGQKAASYELRLRTTKTSPNGEPALETATSDPASRHISASRSEQGNLAVVYCPVGGDLVIQPGILKDGLKAQWFNPRSADRLDASSDGSGCYHAPDENDWVLILR